MAKRLLEMTTVVGLLLAANRFAQGQTNPITPPGFTLDYFAPLARFAGFAAALRAFIYLTDLPSVLKPDVWTRGLCQSFVRCAGLIQYLANGCAPSTPGNR